MPIQLPLSLNGQGRYRYRMKLGTRTIWNGMISVARISANRTRLPRNSNTANAYAAMEHVTTWPIVASDAMTIEFWKNVPNVTLGRANHIVV